MTQNSNNGRVDLSPSKETYRAVRADVNPRSAIKELVDNSIDNWRRLNNENGELLVEIEHLSADESETGHEELIVRDNSGGLEEENLKMFFALGESAKESTESSIGAFGIGAKKACAFLGKTAEFRTNFIDGEEEGGYGFTVDEEWLNSDEWEVEKQRYEDIEAGTTEIRIRDLNFDWEETANPSQAGGDEEDTIIPLDRDLSETYELFLGGGVRPTDYKLRIIVEGKELKPSGEIDWSWYPLDGYHPRRYEGFKLKPGDRAEDAEPIWMNITVGLLREANQERAGIDIYCQRRKVLSNDKTSSAGFGSGRYKLGNFGTGQKRLKVIVEVETKGDASDLPWSSQKDGINEYDSVSQEMYKYVRRVAKPYYSASFSKFRQSLLRPYGPDSPFAVKDPDGGIETYDYEGRERVTDKPDGKARESKEVMDLAEAHSKLGIECDDDLEQKAIPAYQSDLKDYFSNNYTDRYDSLHRVESPPPLRIVENIEIVCNRIDELARRHVADDIQWVGVPEWASFYYQKELAKRKGDDLSELAEVEDLDKEFRFLPEEPSEQPNEREAPDKTQSEPSKEIEEEDRSSSETSSQPLEGFDSAREQTREQPKTGRSSSSTLRTDDDQPASKEKQVAFDLTDTKDSSKDSTRNELSQPQERRPTSESPFTSEASSVPTDAEEYIRVRLPEDARENFFDTLGLSESASPDDVGERLIELLFGKSDGDASKLDAVTGTIVHVHLDEEEMDELLEVLEVDTDATPDEVGKELVELVERFQKVRTLLD